MYGNPKEQPRITEENVIEFLRCRKDPIHFILNYVVLELPGKSELMNLDEKQKDAIRIMHEDHFLIILKSRQTGISTTVQAYVVFLMTFFKNVIIGITSKDGEEASKFGSVITNMIDNLPIWMRPLFVERNKRSIRLKNGCELYARPVNPQKPDNTLRGRPITFLVNDEAAHTRHIEEAYTSMSSTIATAQDHAIKNNIPYGTVVLSTPNKTTGVGKWFYQRWNRALSNKGMFKPMKIYWKDIPRLKNSETWYKKQVELLDGDANKIDQELELKFIPAKGGFFDRKTCSILQEFVLPPIKKEKILNGEAWMFEEPKSEKFYLIGVDTASERGNDMSAIEIIDYETIEQVWEYQGKLAVKLFTGIVNFAASMYSNCLLIVEITGGYGNEVIELLEDGHNAHKLYIAKDEKFYGLKTTIKTRPLIIDSLCYINNYPKTIKSERLSLELIGLQEKKGKIEGDDRDDLAMALGFCYYVRKWDPPLNVNISKSNETFNTSMINPNDESTLRALKNIVNLNRKNNINNKDIKKVMLEKTIKSYGNIQNVLSIYNQ